MRNPPATAPLARLLGALVLGVALVGLAGCGGGEADGAGAEAEAPARRKDPTLRGLVQQLRERGLTVSERRKLGARASQRAAVGRAAGLANELVGANLRSDLATETARHRVEGVEVLLERFASAAKAEAVYDRRVAEEDRRPDAGRVVRLLAGDALVTVRGPEAPTASGAEARLAALQAGARRPTGPPDPELVARLEDALAP